MLSRKLCIFPPDFLYPPSSRQFHRKMVVVIATPELDIGELLLVLCNSSARRLLRGIITELPMISGFGETNPRSCKAAFFFHFPLTASQRYGHILPFWWPYCAITIVASQPLRGNIIVLPQIDQRHAAGRKHPCILIRYVPFIRTWLNQYFGFSPLWLCHFFSLRAPAP